jgi:predicted nucleotidyltransferase
MGELITPTLDLSRRVGKSWANIESARKLSRDTLAQLRQAFADSDSDDTSIVVCGSLGREEFTLGSDIDWTLILDGIADPNHHALFIDAKRKIEAFAPKGVGKEGTFGAMISSHDLIHNIGGEDDTNKNLTRRLLLLLESKPVGRREAHERVVRNILNRYLLEDRSFWRGTGTYRHYIPHFLLNDLARLWRTMAVDFAYKLRDRSGDGWAMRNIKLRMSRKLLYVAGLLGCFFCHLELDDESRRGVFDDVSSHPVIVDVVHSAFHETPLDIVASFLAPHEHLHKAASLLFGAYDEFLGILRDSGLRDHLDNLPADDGDTDDVYQHAREVSHRFRDSLLELFFDDKTGLAELTRLYGVF